VADTSSLKTANREEMESGAFDALCSLLNREYGIDLRATSEDVMQRKLQKYYEKNGLTSLAGCLEFIRGDRARLDEISDFVYSQSTHFNRQAADFKFLVETASHRDRGSASPERKPLTVRCLGCSTGQEAYTISIYLMEYVFTTPESWPDFSVQGSDCSLSSLQKARGGRYGIEDIRRLEPIPYARYFVPGGVGENLSVSPELRRQVEFSQFNLNTSEYDRSQSADYVFLRNALDFHSRESKESILAKLRPTMKDEGYLVLGPDPRIGDLNLFPLGYESLGEGRYRAVRR